jgi:ribosomal protein S18 acetylase RimI-like enzyme
MGGGDGHTAGGTYEDARAGGGSGGRGEGAGSRVPRGDGDAVRAEDGAGGTPGTAEAGGPGTLALAAEANAYAFLVHQGSSPYVRLRVAPDCSLIAADSDARPFNTIFAPAFPPESLAARVREVSREHTVRGRVPVWWIGPSALPSRLPERLAGLGLTPMPPVLLMAAELSHERYGGTGGAREPGAAREIRPVRSRDELAEFVGVHRAAYAAPAEAAGFTFRVFASLPLSEDAPLRHVLVREGGRAVAVASVFLHEGVAGLYNVATVPGARGLGHGTAATLAALAGARAQGAHTATLGAEAGAVEMYSRLGFAACGTLERVSHRPPGAPTAAKQQETAVRRTGAEPAAG